MPNNPENTSELLYLPQETEFKDVSMFLGYHARDFFRANIQAQRV